MKRTLTVLLLAVMLLTVTGCAKSLEDRVKDRDICTKAGGDYVEVPDVFGSRSGSCDLTKFALD